jgi:glycogen debranching enzyme
MTSRPTAADIAALREGAAQILFANEKRGRDPATKTDYAYICPSRLSGYPWQWFWDSCFHAIVLCHIDVKLAERELRTLWSAQQPDGFIPHIIRWGARLLLYPPVYLHSKLSWRPHTSAFIQPPVLAQAALAVAERGQSTEFLAEAIDHVRRYYLYLHDRRDPDADSLISVIHPDETGMDQLPAYDAVQDAQNSSRLGIRARNRLLDIGNLVLGHNYNLEVIFRRDRFNVEDVLVNCIYAQGLRAASRSCRMAGDEPGATSFARMSQRTEDAILAKMRDRKSGAFFGLSGKSEQPLHVLTCSSLMPLLLESIPKDQADALVQRHLLNKREFWLPYPIPSVAASEPSFRPAEQFNIWRGPTWINSNWFLVKALRRHGYAEVADSITQKSVEMVQRSGFREFYNPYTGEGYRAREFSWSTLVVDMV